MASRKIYHRRMVAESDAKACWICHRPSSTVLITSEKDDWFHICPGHLKDRKFATAQDAEDLEEKKRKEELDREIEAVKKEYDEKLKKRQERRKGKDSSEKEDKKASKKEDEADEQDKDAKVKELEGKKDETQKGSDGPRIFELRKDFQQMRLKQKREADQRRRDAEMSRKNLETLKSAAARSQSIQQSSLPFNTSVASVEAIESRRRR